VADFRILGSLEVEDGGTSVDLGGARQRVLLAILLLRRGEPVSADRLIDELYEGHPPPTAAKSLHAHISRLRKALGPVDRLRTEARGYAFRVEPEELDADRFAALLGQARELVRDDPEAALAAIDRALALWRGPPFGDLAYWSFAQAELARLEELRLCCLEERVEAELALGRHVELLPGLERLVAENPSRERLRGQQMLALYRAGRQAEALNAYQNARRALVDELGLEPGSALQALERSILNHDPALDAPPNGSARVPSPQAGRLAAGVFVGRVAELEALEAALADAGAGRGRLVVVAGEAGIGKSRLADEFASRAKRRGARIAWGRCWEAGGAPAYWPWVQAMRTLVRELEPDALDEGLGRSSVELRHLLPELGDDPSGGVDPSSGDGDRFRLFEATAEFLRAAARDRPVLVVLDDVHAAEPSSLLMLEFVATELADAPVLLLAAYREPELDPGDPTLAALSRVARHASARMHLSGLRQDEIASYIELTTPVRATRELVAAIAEETDGNPLFVAEVVRLLAAEGRLDDTPGADWRLTVPESVKEVIEQRLRRLSPRCRDVLEVASVLGREFQVELVERLSGVDAPSLLVLLDEAEGARIIAEAGLPGRQRFTHAVVRDTLYDALPRSRRLELHRLAGETIETIAAGGSTAHLSGVAHHFMQALPAVDARQAVERAQRAANAARGLLAHEEAARLFESALRAVPFLVTPDPHLESELLLGLGDALARAGDMSNARDAFLRAAALARATGSAEDLAAAALGYGGRIVWTRAAGDRLMIALLEEALEALGESVTSWRARVLARLAGALRDELDPTRRVHLGELAVSVAREAGDPAALAYALNGLSAGLQASPDFEHRLAITAELQRVASQVDDKEALYDVHLAESLVYFELGHHAAVRAATAAMHALAEELRQPAQRWATAAMDALLALHEGRFDEAEALIERALVLGQRAQRREAESGYALQLYELRREQGRAGETVELLAAAARETPARPLFRCAVACLAAELGDEAEARRHFEELAAGEFAVVPRDQEWLLSATLLVDTCLALHDTTRTGQLYRLLMPFADRVASDVHEGSAGAVARSLGLLAAALGREDEARTHLEAAVAINEKTEAVAWAAHARTDLAELHLRRGDAAGAAPLLEAASATARRLHMAALEQRLDAVAVA
jgi:DNA-binding SARP family transcriptional activator/tetratricopeptide (TPR) repeat protein